jgi:hypothetical protein
MKNFILGAVLSAVLATQTVKAGDREWAVAGKVLTGVAAITVIDRIVNPPQPVVVYQQPVVVQPAPTVVYVPAPQVVYVQPTPVVYVQPAPVVYYYSQPTVVVYPNHFHPVMYHRYGRHW